MCPRSPLSSSNCSFLESYKSVVEHHIECILKCRLILNEDMQLVTTFWNPTLLKKRKIWDFFRLSCCGSAMIGTIAVYSFFKIETLIPLVVSFLPTLIPVAETFERFYLTRCYKSNFEKLLSFVSEIYTLNNDIMEYFHKRDSSIKNASITNEYLLFILQPGESFLQLASLKLTDLLKQLIACMFSISKLVPICSGEFVYFDDEFLNKPHFEDFSLLKKHFQKLTDYYHLMVSNFLSCFGLTLCVQLWKNKSCNFPELFNKTIPNICEVFGKTLKEIKVEFNNVRFTLVDSKCKPHIKEEPEKFLPLRKPLDDLLTNLQINFQMVRQFQMQVDHNSTELHKLTSDFDKIESQFQESTNSLNTLTKTFYLLTKQKAKTKVQALSPVSNKNKSVVTVCHDDVPEELKDEEYNLIICSEENDEVVDNSAFYNDYVDQCSTEYLELMLNELKNKLRERKVAKNGGVVQEDSDPSPPPSPPPPSISFPKPALDQGSNDDLPVPVNLGGFDKNFLNAVKSVALKFNREEDVFGSDSESVDSEM